MMEHGCARPVRLRPVEGVRIGREGVDVGKVKGVGCWVLGVWGWWALLPSLGGGEGGLQEQEGVGFRQRLQLKSIEMAVGRNGELFLLTVQKLAADAVDLHACRNGNRVEQAVDCPHTAIEVVIDQLHRLAGFLHAVEGGSGTEVVVVELPVESRAGTIEHPLDESCGLGRVVTEGIEHGTCAIVAHHVGLSQIVIEACCLSIAC